MTSNTNGPRLIPIFDNSGSAGLINVVPVGGNVGDAGASYAQGFPQATDTPLSAGGTPPAIGDFNGVLHDLSAGVNWFEAGGPVYFDATFAGIIGGYPKGAILATTALFGDNTPITAWISTTNNNVVNPDSSGTVGLGATGWVSLAERMSDVANVWFTNTSNSVNTVSTSFTNLGNPISVVKKRLTNRIIWTGSARCQNTSGNSPNGCVGQLAIAYSTNGGGAYTQFGGGEKGGTKVTGQTVSAFFPIQANAHDQNSITGNLSYLATLQWASLSGDYVQNNTSSLIGIEVWA